ncbi:hypothetical protein Emag_000567 [Eimeria magna]
MAASSPHVNVEMTEAWTNVSHYFDGPKTSNQLTRLPLPRRHSAFRVGALVPVLFVLALLAATITCFQVFKNKVARRHESMGRRLAAGGEEEEEGDLLAQILMECIGWREEREDTVVADTMPGDAPASPQTSTYQELYHSGSADVFPEVSYAVSQPFTHVSQGFVGHPFLGERVSDGSPLLGDTHSFPCDQPQFSQLESPDYAYSRLQHRLPSPEPFVPDDWQLFFETPTDMSTPQHPEQPSLLETRTRAKRSPPQLAFEDLTESKRQKVTSTQSLEGSSKVLPGLSSLQDFGAIAEQHHQHPWSEQAHDPTVQSAMSPCAQIYFPEDDFFAILHDSSSSPSHPSQQRQPTGAADSSPVASQASSASVAQAGPSFRVPSPAPPMPPSTHLYYRLPVLQSGPICRFFSTREAFAYRSRRSPKEILPVIHRLLSQPSITVSEADLLISCCEQLARHLYGYHKVPVSRKRPCFAASCLARRYLFLEALFCSIQVLGSAMRAESWWPQLLQLIPTDYVAPVACRNSAGTLIAERLSSALALLKDGIRPSLEETVNLKRELFKGKSLKLGFENRAWDDWRKDDDAGDTGSLGS